MQKRVRVAAAAADTRPGEIEANLEKIDLWASQAAAAGAQLVLFPELSLTGFIPNHPQWIMRHGCAARSSKLDVRRSPGTRPL